MVQLAAAWDAPVYTHAASITACYLLHVTQEDVVGLACHLWQQSAQAVSCPTLLAESEAPLNYLFQNRHVF